MIETERLNLRPLEKEDLDSIKEMRNDPQTWHWLTDVFPVQDQEAWFEKLQKNRNCLYLAVEKKLPVDTGFSPLGIPLIQPKAELVGMIRSDEWDRTNRSVRIGIDIAPWCHRQGFGTEAFSAFIDYLFAQQNMHRIWFLVADGNAIAQGLYNKLGFKEEGRQRQALFRDGEYHDYISMSLLEEEWKALKK
jgi:RimJ/RimL family protein N-acetyltransferase